MVGNSSFHQNLSFGETKIEEFKKWLKLRVSSVGTLEQYLCVVKEFLKEYKEINENNILEFLKKHSNNSSYVGALKKYLEYLGKEDLKKKIPYARKKKKIFEVPDFDKCIDKFLEKLQNDEKYIILILYYTGARISEVLNLKMKDIDSKGEYIIFRQTKGDIYERKVKIPEKLKENLLQLKKEKEGLLENDYVFYPDSKNTPRARYYRFLKRIKLKYPEFYKVLTKTHNFRRAFITWMYMQTKDVFQVQQYVGHLDINTTVRYIQEIARKEAIEKGGELVISKKPMPKGL